MSANKEEHLIHTQLNNSGFQSYNDQCLEEVKELGLGNGLAKDFDHQLQDKEQQNCSHWEEEHGAQPKMMRASMEKFRTLLIENEYDLEKVKNLPEFNKLDKRNQKSLIGFAKYEPLLDEFKKEHFREGKINFNVLTLEGKYSPLKQYEKFKQMIRNQKNYRERKSMIRDLEDSNFQSNVEMQEEGKPPQLNHTISSQYSTMVLKSSGPLPKLSGQKDQSQQSRTQEKEALKWNQLMSLCRGSIYIDQVKHLQHHYEYDSHSFIRQLKTMSYDCPFEHFFSVLLDISLNIPDEEHFTIFIAHTFCFYDLETITQEQQIRILEALTPILDQLQANKLHFQSYGLFKLLFVNKFTIPEEDCVSLTNFIVSFPTPWEYFCDFLTKDPFRIRLESLAYIPKTGYIFTSSFISLLTEGSGECFARLPLSFREQTIGICSFSSSSSIEELRHFLHEVTCMTLKHELLLQEGNLNALLSEFKDQLRQRCPLWVGNLGALLVPLKEAIMAFIEKKFKNFDQVLPITTGNNSCLQSFLNQAVQLLPSSVTEEMRLIAEFQTLNPKNVDAQKFKLLPYLTNIKSLIELIEDSFQGKFHYLQQMCISYVLQHLDERCQFLNFGIGNGKSLLCTSIAIILRKIQTNNVIILNSSEYLTYRDYHKFKDCIDNCGLRCSLNAPEARSITYMDEKNFKLLLKGKKQNFEASKAIIIMDEYDQLLFEQPSSKHMLAALTSVNSFSRLIGITGTKLTKVESKILQQCFLSQEVKFPQMKDQKEIKVVQKPNIMIEKIKEWREQIMNMALEVSQSVPVVLALCSTEIKGLQGYFKKHQVVNLHAVCKEGKLSEMQTNILNKFTLRTNSGSYGIYALSEELARGIDFPSSYQIEENGGIFLILGGSFSSATLQQFKGRVGRLQNRGQWQYCLCTNNQNFTPNYPEIQRDIRDLDQLKIKEDLLTLLKEEGNEFQTKILTDDFGQWAQVFDQGEVKTFVQYPTKRLKGSLESFSVSSIIEESSYSIGDKDIMANGENLLGNSNEFQFLLGPSQNHSVPNPKRPRKRDRKQLEKVSQEEAKESAVGSKREFEKLQHVEQDNPIREREEIKEINNQDLLRITRMKKNSQESDPLTADEKQQEGEKVATE